MFEVEVSSMSPERFRAVLAPDRYRQFERGMRRARALLAGRVVWNINSTARGGGVAELLESLVPYARGAGVDARWLVIEGPQEFFDMTKRIHNWLHGNAGDGGDLDQEAREIYEQALSANAPAICERVRHGDVAIVHDPQPAGLIGALRDAGAAVIWRCHVGLDYPNEQARQAWAFLHSYVADADADVFSRASFAWENLDPERIVVIPPSIDVFSPKNEHLDPQAVLHVLRACGVLAGATGAGDGTFQRQDGTPGRVDRRAELFEDAPLEPGMPVVLQISRWDALKDPLGVIRGFADHVPASTDAHLICAGPAVTSVTDDPEGGLVLNEAKALRDSLDVQVRSRVHLAALPMEDPEENAIIVNALQRHARVITQKSLAEGFGLTVAEAMWKARPVVASRIGGIQSQIVDGESGVLLDDPRDLEAFGAAVTELLLDQPQASKIGGRARERVRDQFTSPRSLLDYLAVIDTVLERRGIRVAP
ncbi:MAG TPA: glycosyltransferase [Solirubrobacteraceae bacterium]|nr:glycosyltransferase [Solirubrobacteraceae bacterium]